MKFLVSRVANIHVKDNFALRWSAVNGHLEVVKFLVEQGANISECNDWELDLEVLKYLVYQGANVNAREDYALTI